jgi:hypothetical protein
MKYLAFISLALAACIESQPATSTQSDALASSVYPHQWTGRQIGMSAFWPANATSVQVLITDGDRENGQDTFYAWIIADARYVFTVYRVDKGTNGATFHNAMRAAFNEAESLLPQRYDSITGSGGTGGPIGPPHIGPGGEGGGTLSSGYFSQALVNDALGTAGSLRTVTQGFFDKNASVDGISE